MRKGPLIGNFQDALMKDKNRRRWFPLVDAQLQFKFLAVILGYGATLLLVIGCALFFPDFLVLTDETADPITKTKAAEFILTTHARLWLPVITALLLIGMHFFRSFHRVVGPLYRFRWAYEKIGGGDLGITVRLRANDLLPREEKGLNDMICSLAEKVRMVKDSAVKVSSSFGEIEKQFATMAEPQDSENNMERLLVEHRHAIKSLTEKLSVFTLQ